MQAIVGYRFINIHYRLQIKVKVQGQLVPCMHPEPIRICFINERQCLHAHQAAREAAAAWQVASPGFYVCVAFANYSAPPICIVRAVLYHFLAQMHDFIWCLVQGQHQDLFGPNFLFPCWPALAFAMVGYLVLVLTTAWANSLFVHTPPLPTLAMPSHQLLC